MTNETTTEPIEKNEAITATIEIETESKENTRKKCFSHTVKHKDGGTVTIENYSMKKAILLCCSECEGFESDPRKCNVKNCPLFPFKGMTQKNRMRFDLEKLRANAKKNADILKHNLSKGKNKNTQDTPQPPKTSGNKNF